MNLGNSDPYVRFAGLYDPVLNPLLDGMRRRVTETILAEGLSRVLDLCCGTGRQCRLLHDQGVESMGVDSSAAMLEQARRKSPPNLAYHLADASETPFGDAFFDGVLLSLALHEKSPAVRAAILRESERVVKPEGPIIIVDYIRPASLPGWCARPMILFVERLAGAEHARHQKQYMAEGGLEGLRLEQSGRRRFLPLCLGTMAIAVYRRENIQDQQQPDGG